MAFQLVYTSAAKLLDAGRSGYGTVARSKSITPLVVSAIERVSQFANLRGLDRHRIIHVHRRITAGSNRFHVLTRIVDAGADYTGRTNHLAHHLVISQEEAARAAARGVTPADVLRQFPWRDRWDENARFFDPSEDVALEKFTPDGKESKRQLWSFVTGNPAHARLLSWDGAPRTGVLIVPAGVDPLALLAEGLSEFGPQSWSRSFTTSLETTDELTDLEWIVTTPAAFPEIQPRCGSRTLLDLTNPAALPIPPAPALQTTQLVSVSRQPTGPSYTPPAPDVVTPQPDPRPVVVRVVEKGARANPPAPSPSKEDKKTQIKLLVGLAALLFFVGLIAFLAINSGEHDKVSPPATVITSPSKAPDWDGFSTDFVDRINKVKSVNDLKSARTPPSDNQPVPSSDWLGKLVEARKTIPDDMEKWPGCKDLSDRLALLQKISLALKSAFKTDESKALTKQICENFDSTLVKNEIDYYFRIGNKDKPIFNELKKAIDDGQLKFQDKDFPKRYDILSENIRNHFNNFTSSEIFNNLATSGNVNTADADGFKVALKYRDNPSVNLTQDEKDKIQNSNFVPASIKDPVKNSPENTPKITPALPEDLWKKVPVMEIILVSREKLKTGVQVKLLEAMMKESLAWQKPQKIELKNLKIEVDPPDLSNFKEVKLHLTDEKDSYSWTKDPTRKTKAPKYFFEGLFALENDLFKSARFSYLEKETWIVVDESSEDGLFTDLKFKITLSGDAVQLSGTLADRIKEVEISDKELQVIISSPTKSKANITISSAVIEKMPSLPMPSNSEMIFPFIKLEGIDLQASYAAANKKLDEDRKTSLSKVNDKESKLNDLKSDCGKLIGQLHEVVGTTYASKIISRNGANFDLHKISKKDRDNIIENFKNIAPKLDISILHEKSNAWEKCIDDKDEKDEKRMKENIKTQSSAFYRSLGKSILEHSKEFDLGAFDSKSIRDETGVVEKNYGAAIKSTADFLKRAEAVSVPIEQQRQAYLAQLTTLTVQTKSGRVLFKATKEP